MDKYTKKEIIAYFVDKIENKELVYGDRLATERELMDQFSVSRSTIRNVISELEMQRLVYRVPDTGVFVQKEIIRNTNRVRGFTQLAKDKNKVPETKVLCLKKVVANDLVIETMNLEKGTEVYLLERVRYIDQEPFLYEKVYMNPLLVEGIEKYDLECNSLYTILQDVYAININYKREEIKAVTVDGVISDFLYKTSTAYALKVEGCSYDDQDQVIEFGVSYYNAKEFSYKSVLVNA